MRGVVTKNNKKIPKYKILDIYFFKSSLYGIDKSKNFKIPIGNHGVFQKKSFETMVI